LRSDDLAVIAFTLVKRGRPPHTYVAPVRTTGPVPEPEWIDIGHDAHHPFWSPDGALVYFVSGHEFGSQTIRARRFDPRARAPLGDPFDVYRLNGLFVPAIITSGAALVATADQILVTLGDFRGDVWITSLSPER
jgi:hypothetical protein